MQSPHKMIKMKAKELFALWKMVSPIPICTFGCGSGCLGQFPSVSMASKDCT